MPGVTCARDYVYMHTILVQDISYMIVIHFRENRIHANPSCDCSIGVDGLRVRQAD